MKLTMLALSLLTSLNALAMQVTYFECVFPEGINLTKKGQIILRTQRDGQKGNEATYDLPLKLIKPDDGHGNHH